MSKSKLLFVTFLLLIASIAGSAQSASPAAAVEAFYKYDGSNSQVFTKKNIDARKRWFSASLYGLFQKELQREAAYLKKNPTDKPYFGDGLPFQPLDETCKVGGKDTHRSVKIKQEFAKTSRAAATASFAYPKGCTQGDLVVYTIGLVKENGKWVIDDVNFGEDTSLKQRLNRKEY